MRGVAILALAAVASAVLPAQGAADTASTVDSEEHNNAGLPLPSYSITDTGVLEGGFGDGFGTTVMGINRVGDIAGETGPALGASHAFLYRVSCACVTDLGPGEASALSDSLAAVGAIDPTGTGQYEAELWHHGRQETLPVPPSTYGSTAIASGVNDAGQIVGSITPDQFSEVPLSQAILWQRQGSTFTVVDLSTADTPGSAAAVNNRGHVTGTIFPVGNETGCKIGIEPFALHAFLYKDGAMHDLGSLSPDAGDYSLGNAISESDEIVGETAVGADCSSVVEIHAMAYRNGTMHDLGTLVPASIAATAGTGYSTAFGVNDRGEIVGQSDIDATGTMHAFLYDRGKMFDLNSLVDPNDPLARYVTLTAAWAINCGGWIAAEGTDSRDGLTNHIYLLKTPANPNRNKSLFIPCP